MKRCDTCKEHLALSHFWKNRYKHDGLASTCKDCQRANADRKKAYCTLLIREQEGRCAICNKEESSNKKDFAVDHDHTSGFVRGALCNHCNSGLGGFMDNPELLYKAIEYLVEAKEKQNA